MLLLLRGSIFNLNLFLLEVLIILDEYLFRWSFSQEMFTSKLAFI